MIESKDLHWRFAIKEGNSGNTLPQLFPHLSLGGFLSTTDWEGGGTSNFFDDIKVDDANTLITQYRCIFIFNNHHILTLHKPSIWFATKPTAGSSCSLGLDPYPPSLATKLAMQATLIDHDRQAPKDVEFTSPGSPEEALVFEDLPPGFCRAFWVERTVLDFSKKESDSFALRIRGWSIS